ncbi:FAD-binding protein, partial [Streptomyces sp. SID5475]|nr:FAD-binding protein [Streptomyces sp. SID5475]
MRTPITTSDVLVAGAGPTGLLLAGDLAAAGLSVTVLEKRPAGRSSLTRAFAVHARTLEQLDARGLADGLVARGTPLERVELFGTLALDLGRLPSRFPFLLVTPQYEVERLLERRAAEHGVRFRYGSEVTGLRQDPDGVEVTAAEEHGTATHRAAYLVGTDGHHSTVRRALGLPFPGGSVIRSLVLADVRLDREPPELLALRGDGENFALVVPFGDGWYRVGGWNRHRQVPDHAPVDLAEVRDIMRRALGDDFGMRDPRWLSRFHSEERQVPAYRTGRVLLAGDAAHVHSPAGGQGMNTGLQDAANLGWKLTAVLRDGAPGSLLDTYHEERHPVGRMVLRSSGAILRLAMAPGRPGP